MELLHVIIARLIFLRKVRALFGMKEAERTEQPLGALVNNWTSRPYPEKIILEGNFCRLEPLCTEKHALYLFDAYQKAGADMWTYIPEGPFQDVEHFRTMIDKSVASKNVHFAIVNKKTECPVGQFCLMRCDPANGVVEVGYVLFSPALKKTTMATEAHYLLMKYVFENLKYRRYEWKCDSLNAASRKAALRLGFQYEGTFRQAAVSKGRNRDTHWFSIIDREWNCCRLAFERWLSCENFDQGKQKVGLNEIRSAIL